MKNRPTHNLIDVAMGRVKADLCIRNVQIADVFNGEFFTSSVLVKDGLIAGFSSEGSPDALITVDAEGSYLLPGFIDSHVHIESSHCSPTAFSDAVVPHGTTTVIADPHEICNVSGLAGLDYMIASSENASLEVFFMVPSCVPATEHEHAGAVLDSQKIERAIGHERVLGLGEMMNFPGVLNNDEEVLRKLAIAEREGKLVDGHAPGLLGQSLDAYCAAGIISDHESETPDELKERIRRGMYVMLRQGSACKNLPTLMKGVTKDNMRFCLFCTDDKQPHSMLEEGHINYNARLAIAAGMAPIDAVRIASLNAATCYGLHDRGAIAPGRRADFFLTRDLFELSADRVFIAGVEVARDRKILEPSIPVEPKGVGSSVQFKPLDETQFALPLKSSKVRVIDIIPGGVVTSQGEAEVTLRDGSWVHDPLQDILLLAVIERHHATGHMGKALIRGYGMTHGAIATTIAHDSHNIIVIGDTAEDMHAAVASLKAIGGGITMVKNNQVLASLPHPIAGLMSDSPVSTVHEQLSRMHEIAHTELKVSQAIDPFMTLSFMALPVIPTYKLTDMGLFDVTSFSFVPLEL